MSKVNQLIIAKLDKYDETTSAIGKKALELAERYTEQAISEQLESFVRRIVRKNEDEI